MATMVEAADRGALPRFVERDFLRYLACGVLAHGFARLACPGCHAEVLVPPAPAQPPHPLGRAPPADLPHRRPHLPALRRLPARRRRRPSLHHRPGHPPAPAASLEASPSRPRHLSAPAGAAERCPKLETRGPG